MTADVAAFIIFGVLVIAGILVFLFLSRPYNSQDDDRAWWDILDEKMDKDDDDE